MKVKTAFILLVVCAGLLGSCASMQPQVSEGGAWVSEEEQEVRLIGMHDIPLMFMLIKDGELSVYSYSDAGWQKEIGVQLPQGARGVFYLRNWVIGMIVNDVIRLYQLRWNDMDEGYHELVELPEESVTLPAGSTHVTGLGRHIGVVSVNSMDLYADGNKQDVLPPLRFLHGGETIFWSPLGGQAFAVVIRGAVRFFQVSDRYPEIWYLRFQLPDGFTGVIGLSDSYTGVIVDDVLRIYKFTDSWKEIPDLRFEMNGTMNSNQGESTESSSIENGSTENEKEGVADL